MPFDGVAKEIDLAWTARARSQDLRLNIRNRLAEAQNWRCCYCGVRLDGTVQDPDTPVLVCVLPTSRGGDRFSVDNLAVSCLEHKKLRGEAMWPIHIETLKCMGVAYDG